MPLKNRPWKRGLFLFYIALMLWLLYGQRIGDSNQLSFSDYWAANVNLEPFRTIRNYWYAAFHTSNRSLLRHIIINLAGNVIMFIPLGFLLPLNWQGIRRWYRLILVCAAIIIAIELLQVITMLGSLDIDDLILNLAGCWIGYGLCKIWEK